jgi:uncharacterized SAM-binding protein YcdF (DUF218 family)
MSYAALKPNTVQSRKRRWFRRLRRVAAVVLLLWVWQVILALMLIDAYGRLDRAQPADVIVVLGAGLRRDNTPGPALTRRSTHAADLWKQGLAPLIVCSGGKPGNRTRSEADACAELLQANGVPADAIILEDRSRSTEENAIYTKELMDARGWATAILVSDPYHMFRADHIFQGLGVLVFTSPVAEYNVRANDTLVFTLREIVALHWQVLKQTLNLPVTYVQGI